MMTARRLHLGRLFAIAAVGGLASRWASDRRGEISFQGKVVFITGGSRGLGLVLARQLAREGARIFICARKQPELELAQKQVHDLGGECEFFVADVASKIAVEAAVRACEEKFGPVDVLVNNASIIQVGPALEMSNQDFRSAMDVNFWGTYYATEAVLPSMLVRGQGRILNVTSIGGVLAVPHLLPYTAAKFAAFGYSMGLGAELSGKGVSVTTAVPGLMRTGSFSNALFKGQREKEVGWFSFGATAPVLSMNAERAARKMIEACRRRRSCVTIGVPAKAGRLFYHLLPNTAATIFGWGTRVLPAEAGTRHEKALEGKRFRETTEPKLQHASRS